MKVTWGETIVGKEDSKLSQIKDTEVRGLGGPLLERQPEGIRDDIHTSDLGIVGSNY